MSKVSILSIACMRAKSFSHVQLFATHRAPLSMEFSRQEYWSGLPCSPGDFPKTGTDTGLLWLLHFSWIFHCWATRVVLSTVYSLPKGSWREMNECSVLRKIVRNISSQFTFSKRSWSLLPLVQFSSVQSLSRVRVFATPWIAAGQASLSITNSRSLLKLMPIESVMPSSHLILCRPLLLLPQSLPASGSFPMSQLFAWGGQSTGVSASASVLPMNT